MYGRKLCINLGVLAELGVEREIELYKSAGFDAIFPCYKDREQLLEVARIAKEKDMIIQSVHAPFTGSAKMWQEGETGEKVIEELIECVKASAEVGAPIVVCHAYIGFYTGETPTALGLKRIRRLVEVARELGVKIAFENTEGEEFLFAILKEFENDDALGFCWDSGHEQCYNGSEDMLAKYGKKLIATHLNDNLGVSNAKGIIDWTDDLHLLPFDGMIDWIDAGSRLAKTGFDGILTFELTRASKPNRHDNDKYAKMTAEEYAFEAYGRAVRFANIYKRIKK